MVYLTQHRSNFVQFNLEQAQISFEGIPYTGAWALETIVIEILSKSSAENT